MLPKGPAAPDRQGNPSGVRLRHCLANGLDCHPLLIAAGLVDLLAANPPATKAKKRPAFGGPQMFVLQVIFLWRGRYRPPNLYASPNLTICALESISAAFSPASV